jgi:hypothetical protein
MNEKKVAAIGGITGLSLIGCTGVEVAAAAYTVIMFLGTALVSSAIGYTLENALDTMFMRSPAVTRDIQDVAIDAVDPTKGVAKHPVKFDVNDRGAAVVLENAAVVRSFSTSNDWHLDPALVQELKTKAKNEF